MFSTIAGIVCVLVIAVFWFFSMSVAYKTGMLVGDIRGHLRGFTQGYAAAKKNLEEQKNSEIW